MAESCPPPTAADSCPVAAQVWPIVRPARPDDLPAIRSLLRRSRGRSRTARWEDSVVAEFRGQIVGTARVQTERDGTKVGIGLAVARSWRRRGLGSEIVRFLQRSHTGPGFLLCWSSLQGFYAGLGFRRVRARDLPRGLARRFRVYTTLSLLWLPQTLRGRRLIVMKWDGDPAGKAQVGST
jgi:N-acetylglutamate synthase-like GNAT family acetyltransferase